MKVNVKCKQMRIQLVHSKHTELLNSCFKISCFVCVVSKTVKQTDQFTVEIVINQTQEKKMKKQERKMVEALLFHVDIFKLQSCWFVRFRVKVVLLSVSF